MRFAAVCFAVAMEIAQPLFWHRNTQPTLNAPAKFIASWKSPSEVAPSPNVVSAIRFVPRSFSAQARPTACTMWPPTVIDGGRTLTDAGGHPPSSCPVRPAYRSSIGYPCIHIAAASR
jgi:hypothetical protein